MCLSNWEKDVLNELISAIEKNYIVPKKQCPTIQKENSENKKPLKLNVLVPGVDPKTINITLSSENILTVEYKFGDDKVVKNYSLRKESDPNTLKAVVKYGVLEISATDYEQPKPKQIPVEILQ